MLVLRAATGPGQCIDRGPFTVGKGKGGLCGPGLPTRLLRMHDRARERAIAGIAFTFLLLSLPLTGSLVRGAISSERSRGLTVQYHKPSNPHTSFPRVRARTPSLTFPGSPVTGHFLHRRVRPATQGFDSVLKGPSITVFVSGVPVPDRLMRWVLACFQPCDRELA